MSIASSPHRLPQLCVHFRANPTLAESALLEALFVEGQRIQVSGPAGEVRLDDALGPPLFCVAAGSGISQVFAMLDWLSHKHAITPVTVLWSVAQESDFYMTDELSEGCNLARIVDPVIGPENQAIQWLRVHANKHAKARTVLCGAPGFVYEALNALESQGWRQEDTESDAYAYAPRPS